MDLKEYSESLSRKAAKVFLNSMEKNNINLFKVDKVVVVFDSRFSTLKEVVIEKYKGKELLDKMVTSKEREHELIKKLYHYENEIENEIGVKIEREVKELKGFFFTNYIVTWTIDCTNIKYEK